MLSNLTDHPWRLVFPLLAVGALVTTLISQRRGDWGRAFAGSSLFIAGLLTTMAAGLYPYILPAHDGKPHGLPDVKRTNNNALQGHFRFAA